jgi:hypothetical protein
VRGDLSDRTRTVAELLDDRAAVGIAQRAERVAMSDLRGPGHNRKVIITKRL